LSLFLAAALTFGCISLPASAAEMYYLSAETADTPDTADISDSGDTDSNDTEQYKINFQFDWGDIVEYEVYNSYTNEFEKTSSDTITITDDEFLIKAYMPHHNDGRPQFSSINIRIDGEYDNCSSTVDSRTYDEEFDITGIRSDLTVTLYFGGETGVFDTEDIDSDTDTEHIIDFQFKDERVEYKVYNSDTTEFEKTSSDSITITDDNLSILAYMPHHSDGRPQYTSINILVDGEYDNIKSVTDSTTQDEKFTITGITSDLTVTLYYGGETGVFDTDDTENLDSLFSFKENSDGTYIVTAYWGSDTEVTLPEKYKGKTVTLIEDNFCFFRDTVKTVTIPKTIIGVKTYGYEYEHYEENDSDSYGDSIYTIAADISPFYTDGIFEAINVDPENPVYTSIDGVLYTTVGQVKNSSEQNEDSDKLILVQYPPKKKGFKFTVPENVKYIGTITAERTEHEEYYFNRAFDGNKELKAIVIGDNVKGINDKEFRFFLGLIIQGYEGTAAQDFALSHYRTFEVIGNSDPNKNFEYRYQIFEDDYNGKLNAMITQYLGSVQDVILPNEINGHKVTKISNRAFMNNSSIRSITINKDLEDVQVFDEMGDYVYDMEHGITDGHEGILDKQVISTVTGFAPMFINCENLECINVEQDNRYFKSIDGVLYNKSSDGSVELLQYPANKPGEEFMLPENAVTIGLGNTFWGETIEPERAAAFSNCKNLKKLVIPETVNNLEQSAFYGEIPVLYVYKDSQAHIFAKKYNFEYVLIDDTETDDIPYGDINGDGKVTAKDSMAVQRYAIKLTEFSDEQLKAADVDIDGKVTAKDALNILRCAIQLAVLPIQD